MEVPPRGLLETLSSRIDFRDAHYPTIQEQFEPPHPLPNTPTKSALLRDFVSTAFELVEQKWSSDKATVYDTLETLSNRIDFRDADYPTIQEEFRFQAQNKGFEGPSVPRSDKFREDGITIATNTAARVKYLLIYFFERRDIHLLVRRLYTEDVNTEQAVDLLIRFLESLSDELYSDALDEINYKLRSERERHHPTTPNVRWDADRVISRISRSRW